MATKQTINKSDLVKVISDKTKATQSTVNDVVSAFCDSITESLQKGKSVILVGFGTFTTGQRKARTGRNPQNGKVIQIPAATVAKFRAGKSLKEAVSKKKGK